MKKTSIYNYYNYLAKLNWVQKPHKPVKELQYCNCNHPKCNGKYIQCFKDQKTCLHSYWNNIDKIKI